MKTFTIYKAKSGYWIAEFSIKNSSKPRRIPLTDSPKEAIRRYESKGYKFVDTYGHKKFFDNE